MHGVELASRFSLPTNALGYCGPAGAAGQLRAAATRGDDLERAEEELRGFEALMPYLEMIAARNHLPVFDRRVVEAYWIGNELLAKCSREDMVRVLDRLVGRGLPASYAQEMASRLPEKPVLHHLFHVSFVGVGAVTGHVETTLENMEACRPSCGTVVSMSAGKLTLLRPQLRVREGRFELAGNRMVEAPHDPELLPNVRVGSRVALHWGMPILELSPHQESALQHFSKLSLEAVNSSLSAPSTTAAPTPERRPGATDRPLAPLA